MDMRLKCQKCGKHTSTEGGKRYRGKLMRCKDCRKPPLTMLAVTMLLARSR